jgi:solute carrier family 50 protein (sugar transporter)
MMDARVIILEYICPTLGMIVANQMFFAPYRDVQKAIARGSLGDLNPLPWAFMLGNCCGWCIYAFLIKVRKRQENAFIQLKNREN